MTFKNISSVLCFTVLFFIWAQDGVCASSKKKASDSKGDPKLYKQFMDKINEADARFAVLRSDLGKLDPSSRMSKDERSALKQELGALLSGIDEEYREAKKEMALSGKQSKSITLRIKELKESIETGEPVRLGEGANDKTVKTLGGVAKGVKTLGAASEEGAKNGTVKTLGDASVEAGEGSSKSKKKNAKEENEKSGKNE